MSYSELTRGVDQMETIKVECQKKVIPLQETEYMNDSLFSDTFYPIDPDEWPRGGHRMLHPSLDDLQYFGNNVLRIATDLPVIESLAIKVYISGKKIVYTNGCPRIRIYIEFLKDGEDSEFGSGYLWLGQPFRNIR
jgi:hypothetical protein